MYKLAGQKYEKRLLSRGKPFQYMLFSIAKEALTHFYEKASKKDRQPVADPTDKARYHPGK
ncbi:MAG: hypothetical protein N2376_12055 [Clostridia bacterium]|nr:hypothetical protein [Clostridia bacterium]